MRRFLFLVALAAVVLFILLARWVLAGDSMPFDLAIRSAVHTWVSPLVTSLLFGITTLGSGWLMAPLGALALWRLEATHRARQAIRLAAGSLGAEAVAEFMKFAFHRPRPAVFFGLPPAATYSFPSGHAFVGTVFYGLLAGMFIAKFPRERRRIEAVTAVTILLIGLSRVYLGYHYPTDVLSGWLCATAWLSMTRLWSAV